LLNKSLLLLEKGRIKVKKQMHQSKSSRAPDTPQCYGIWAMSLEDLGFSHIIDWECSNKPYVDLKVWGVPDWYLRYS
jgi:hypothetical protein